MENYISAYSPAPAIDIVPVNHPAAFFRLLRALSWAEQSRAAVIRWAASQENETLRAVQTEQAGLYLDDIREIRYRLSILLEIRQTELREIEEYCAQPLVDLETVAHFTPKLASLQHQITLISNRLTPCPNSNSDSNPAKPLG